MNKIKEARLNMYETVIAYCNNNTAIVATVPAFQTSLAGFATAVDKINLNARMEADVITGIAADKASLRIVLCQKAADLGAVVFAFASTSNNNELMQKTKFTLSELKRLKDGLLSLICTNIRDAAQANLASLATAGVTAATLTDFQTAIDSYANKATSPRNAVSQRSVYSQALNNFFAIADGIVKKQLDKWAVQFKADNIDFYNGYKSNRKIVDPGTSATQIAGDIISANNNLPVQGATVQLVGTSITGSTDADGNFVLKSVAIGPQSIKITKPGFADAIIDNIIVKL